MNLFSMTQNCYNNAQMDALKLQYVQNLSSVGAVVNNNFILTLYQNDDVNCLNTILSYDNYVNTYYLNKLKEMEQQKKISDLVFQYLYAKDSK